MKKVFVLALALLMALVGMGAAEAKAVESLTGGYYAVRFDDGYTGFCIDNLLAVAAEGNDFTATSTGGAESNLYLYTQEYNAASDNLKEVFFGQDAEDNLYYNTETKTSLKIDQYLKAAIVHHHDKLFAKNSDGTYYDAYLSNKSGSINLGVLCWVFSDSRFKKIPSDFSMEEQRDVDHFLYITGYRPNATMASIFLDVVDRVDNQKETIPDHYLHTLSDGTVAEFDFKVMDSADDSIQDYFAFKIAYHKKASADVDDMLEMNASIPSYRWAEEINGEFVPMTGETEASLRIDPIAEGHEGKRYCCTTTGKNYVVDTIFTVDVNGIEVEETEQNTPPQITAPTADQDVIFTADDEKIELVASASDVDGDELTFTWYEYVENSSPVAISGAVSNGGISTLTLNPSEDDYDGRVFYCEVIDNKEGTTPTQSPKFTVEELTIAWNCELPESVAENASVALKVKGENAESYTWYVTDADGNTTKLATGSSDTYTVSNVTADRNGNKYFCVAKSKNDLTVSTTEFTLSVTEKAEDVPPTYLAPTVIEDHPFIPGQDVTLTMPSEEAEYASFAWYAMGGDGEPVLLAEVSDTFTISNCATEHHGMVLVCVAADEAGNKKSLGFRLVKKTVELPTITSPAQNTEVPFFAGENITLSITAEHADTYQWYVDKGNGKLEKINGANESSYTITNIPGEQDGWAYLCDVSDGSVGVLSKAFIMCRMEAPAMPQTVDDSALFAWAGLMLCAIAACGVILRRKDAVR